MTDKWNNIETVLATHGDYTLIHTKAAYSLQYCWYFYGGKHHEAEFRNDSLIYANGFKTESEARAWPEKARWKI